MYRRGFTLLEVIIVIVILAIISGILLQSFQTFNRSQALSRDAENIIAQLELARSNTLAAKNGSQYGVHVTSTSTTLFAGATYVSNAATNQVFVLNNANTASYSLTGGGADILFNRLIGDTDQNGTITLTSTATGRTLTVTIYKTGLIQ